MRHSASCSHASVRATDGPALSRCAGEGQRSACGRNLVRGFTLLELIVVVAIFAIFAMLAYGGLDAVLKTRDSVERAQLRLAELQKGYRRLRDDFQQLSPRPARDGFGDLQPALRGADNAGVELTRAGWRNPMGLPRPTLERVAYKLGDDGLHRLSWRTLDLAQDSKPVDLLLLSGVTDLRWRFLDVNREWQTQWPALNTTQSPEQAAAAPPPVAVEVRLKLRDLGELRYLFKLGLDPQRSVPVLPGSDAGGPGAGTAKPPVSGGEA